MATIAHAATAPHASSTAATTSELPRGVDGGDCGGGGGGVVGSGALMVPLDFDVRAEFDHAVGGDVEEVGRPRRVARHPREEMVAPVGHAGRVGHGDHRLAR